MVDYTEAEQVVSDLVSYCMGFSADPQPDTVSVGDSWTIGYGSTRDLQGRAVTADTPSMTEIQANQLAMLDMLTRFHAVAATINLPFSPQEQAAVQDFIYSVGAGNVEDSVLLRLVNQNQWALAAQRFAALEHAHGKVISGLLRRGLAEERIFPRKAA